MINKILKIPNTSHLPNSNWDYKQYSYFMKNLGLGKFVKTGTANILTQREIEYLTLAATGHKNREIAEILTVTVSTVKKTFESIFRKINAKDRTHAVAISFAHKILTPVIIDEVTKKYARQ